MTWTWHASESRVVSRRAEWWSAFHYGDSLVVWRLVHGELFSTPADEMTVSASKLRRG